ncbi:MAG: thiol:disulfide interchange protein DsbA/DsbL [Proteobacteria bacterium]|nr:thiol:disulfide interchange protein DsbA/DsbL [Pseudomonadota bacterium]
MQRRDVLKQLSAAVAIGLVGRPVLAQSGSGFELVSPPQPTEVKGKVEVIEFFHYGCPHCRAFDPLLEQWVKKLPGDVYFHRVPVTWGNPQLTGFARLHLTLAATGDLPRLHGQIFDAIQADKQPLHTEAGAQEWAVKKGVDSKKFLDAYRSFGVQVALQRVEKLGRDYKIQGVPTLAIDGKYFTSASIAGSHEASLKVADQLIVRARGEQGRK